MVQSAVFTQIEKAIPQLSREEQLSLIERLVSGLRHGGNGSHPGRDAVLAEMAADPEIQHELAQIALEFASTEMDGLGQP